MLVICVFTTSGRNTVPNAEWFIKERVLKCLHVNKVSPPFTSVLLSHVFPSGFYPASREVDGRCVLTSLSPSDGDCRHLLN